MDSKKKQGVESFKTTKGGTRRDDRQITSKTVFDPITITASNAFTVICMLKSPENEVLARALSSLDAFAEKSQENLVLLTSLGIGSYLLPLIYHEDIVVKRFAQKLVGALCSLKEFREQLLETNSRILEMFVNILEKEEDVVMHEYVTLALAAFSSDYDQASALLKVENTVETLFSIITSADPDVEKNCLEIMNHLLDDIFGIEAFIECPNFDVNSLLILTLSNYPVIQTLALEVLTKLTSWCRDPTIIYAVRDAQGYETILSILEKNEWKDVHEPALNVIINGVDCPDLCDYFLQSGCLARLINILENGEITSYNEKILGVLARMSQTKKGRIALCKIGMMETFIEYLRHHSEVIQESACLGIANLAQYAPCCETAVEANPIPLLLSLVVNEEKKLGVRNSAAYALSILCREDVRAGRFLLDCKDYENLTEVLFKNEEMPGELCRNIIQIFTGVAQDDNHRCEIATKKVLESLLSCLQGNYVFPVKDTALQVDVLECLVGILIECKAMRIFLGLNCIPKLLRCLQSKFASLREWGGHLVVVASHSLEFVKIFINFGGLNWLFKEKKTRYSMPSWESALEAIFSRFLPAKFAFLGRLELNDITEDGFYVLTRQHDKFFLMDSLIQQQCDPLHPIYFSIINPPEEFTTSFVEPDIITTQTENTKAKSVSDDGREQKKHSITIETMPDKNINEIYSNIYSQQLIMPISFDEKTSQDSYKPDQYKQYSYDPYLSVCLENLKKKIAKEESAIGDTAWRDVHPKLVERRARIIAEYVASEMAGSNPYTVCTDPEKEKFISELKFALGTNMLPLGLIKTGSFLERAMLFKVLSDRIGFPCSLNRNEYGKSWIEIAIPSINVNCPSSSHGSIATSGTDSSRQPTEEFQSKTNIFYGETESRHYWFPQLKMEFYKGLPSECLTTNAIVDLVVNPGKIIMLNSLEAEEYLGIKGFK